MSHVAHMGDGGEDVDLTHDHARQVELARRAVQADEEHATPRRAPGSPRPARQARRSPRSRRRIRRRRSGRAATRRVAAGGSRGLVRTQGRRRRQPVGVDVDRDDAPVDGAARCRRMMNEPIPPAPMTATDSSGACATRESAGGRRRAAASSPPRRRRTPPERDGRYARAGHVLGELLRRPEGRAYRYSAHRFVRTPKTPRAAPARDACARDMTRSADAQAVSSLTDNEHASDELVPEHDAGATEKTRRDPTPRRPCRRSRLGGLQHDLSRGGAPRWGRSRPERRRGPWKTAAFTRCQHSIWTLTLRLGVERAASSVSRSIG